MAMTEMNYVSGGGVSGGFFQSGVTPNTSTPLEFELGFVPKQVVIYLNYQTTSFMLIRLDVVNNAYYRSLGTVYENPLTGVYDNDIYVVGTKLYYKAHAANYDVESVIIAS